MASDLLFCQRINTLSYDTDKEVLSISFRTGYTWNFRNVTQKVYRQFESASNQNKYFDRNIYGNYPIDSSVW